MPRPVRSFPLLVLLLGLALAAPPPVQPTGSPPAVVADVVERGLAVYRTQSCAACHQLAAIGARGVLGPPHDAMGVIAGARLLDPAYRGAATDAAGYLRESIVAPEAYRVPGYLLTHHRMPAYTSLGDEDLAALVALLLAQTGAALRAGPESGPESDLGGR